MQSQTLPRQVLDWVAMLVRLRDGDREGLRQHYLALGPEDRQLRFGHAVDAAFIDDYVAGIDFAKETVFGVRSGPGQWIGIGHLAADGGDGFHAEPPAGQRRAAELGLSVLPAVRGHGLGAAIFRFAVAHASRAGVERLHMRFLTRNQAVLALARDAEMEIRSEAGESAAHLVVPRYEQFVRMLIEQPARVAH